VEKRVAGFQLRELVETAKKTGRLRKQFKVPKLGKTGYTITLIFTKFNWLIDLSSVVEISDVFRFNLGRETCLFAFAI
jgi:hypothetical protein